MIGITVADSELSPFVHLINISHSNLLSPKVILMVRTWAIWNRTPRIAGVLVVIFLATFIPMYYCLYLFLNSVQCKKSICLCDYLTWINMTVAKDPLKEFTGCLISSASPILFGSYALLMAFETGQYALLFPSCTWLILFQSSLPWRYSKPADPVCHVPDASTYVPNAFDSARQKCTIDTPEDTISRWWVSSFLEWTSQVS
jgi:hypothetical protein